MLKRQLVKKKDLSDIKHKVQSLTSIVSNATQFVREIEKGNLEVSLNANETSSELIASLISMRDQMKRFAIAEQERSWVNEGLARFVEILRSRNNDTLNSLSDSILKNLVGYLKANQGALFLFNDDDPNNPFLEMSSCYAYERKKHIQKKLAPGEGMVGQAFLEKGTIYMTEVPGDFVKITSGLGEAAPRYILIVALKVEETVYGVVEIASFYPIKQYQIEFVEKLGESIASTIASVRVNHKTKALLDETQLQAEHMRSQEEEMRQSMEELSATQEEMKRVMEEVQRHERFTKGILDSSSDMIVTIDREYKILNFNKALSENFKQMGLHVDKGFDITNLVKPEDRPRHIEKYEQAFNGIKGSLNERYVFGEIDQFIVFEFTPIRNENQEIIAVTIFAKDITEIQTIKNKVEESEKYLSDVLNVFTDPTMTIDRDYKLVLFNKHYQDSFTKLGFPIEVGFNVLNLFDSETAINEKKQMYDAVFDGQVIETTDHLSSGGLDNYYQTVHAPIYDVHGKVSTIAIIAKDITEITKARMAEQQQHEELKAQEEELRQNMEELSATQEEMDRLLTEAQNKEAFVSGLINASTDSIFTLDSDLCILNFNDSFKSTYKNSGIEIEKGLPIRRLSATETDADRYESYFRRALNGESFDLQEHYTFGEITAYYHVSYVPMRNLQNEVYAIAVFTRDVTDLTIAKQKAEDLLYQSQQQTEELKAQEEELRQNMEELSATQEEMDRLLTEAQSKEAFVSELINASTDSILTLDTNLCILNFNEAFRSTYKNMGIEIEKGLAIRQLAGTEADADRYEANYKRALNGETFDLTEHYTFGTITAYYHVSYVPLRNLQNEVYAVAIFTRDVTALTMAKQKAEDLLYQSQQQTEELKAQEEELRQNMEELSATQELISKQNLDSELVFKQVQVKEMVINSTILMSESDLNGTITYVNDKLCEVTQYSSKELIGKPHSILRHPDMPKELFKLLWTTIKKGMEFKAIIKNRKKDGGHYWVDATIMPVKDNDGKIIKYISARYPIKDDGYAMELYKAQAKSLKTN